MCDYVPTLVKSRPFIPNAMSESAKLHTTSTQVIPENLADIAPYSDEEFSTRMQTLACEPGFEFAVKYVMPKINFQEFKDKLVGLKTRYEFQHTIMHDFLEYLVETTTSGLSCSGLENIPNDKCCTFLSNHRDIVLDASFMNLCLMRNSLPLTQVAIGNNLLITSWITDLVKLNGSFVVKRDVRKLQALEAARQLSEYIHYVTAGRIDSVWIAQRQGRAKDSNDQTQESLVKMLAMPPHDSGFDSKESLLSINLLPVSISYEYDPNDYLKATEYLMKRRNPEHKKSPHDDLLSMETGLMGQKGRVHFHFSRPINSELALLPAQPRTALTQGVCNLLDNAIHSGYKIFPCNYIAYDILNRTDRFVHCYSNAELSAFETYLDSQIAKIRIENISEEEYDYLRRMMYTMYANPLVNMLKAKEAE